MAGFFRNFLTVLLALLSYGTVEANARIRSVFFVTLFDTGLSKLKSDKYFQLVEAAQYDFLIKNALIKTLLSKGYSFVNASQIVKFYLPIRIFKKIHIDSEIIFWDDKWAYFCHLFFVNETVCAKVLVKMKFKQGRLTINPHQLLGLCPSSKPAYLSQWDSALESL